VSFHLPQLFLSQISPSYKDGPLEKVAVEYLNLRDMRQLDLPMGGPQYRMLERFLKNVQITTKTAKRTRIIRALCPNAGLFEFTTRDGVTQTVSVRLWRNSNLSNL